MISPGIDHLKIAPPKIFYFRYIGIKVGVRSSDEVFHRRAVPIGHGFVGHGETSVSILGKDEVGVRVDDLSQKRMRAVQFGFRPFPLRDIVSDRHATLLAVQLDQLRRHQALTDVAVPTS